MARTVKEHERAIKRKEIIDVVQRLVYTRGFDQMSIQDILNELQISKGAFYHYFDSKQALLDALIERIVEEAEPVVLPIVQDPTLPAMDKLHRFFDTSARWKAARKDYLLALMRVWYADENVLVREKAMIRMTRQFSPMLAGIIRQGVAEGVMNTPFPDQMGEMTLTLLQSLGDSYMDLLFAETRPPGALQHSIDLVAAYNDALERMLGTAPGALNLVDVSILEDWFITASEVTQPAVG
ncbi:MAG: TetR/AcrR family transcriptional regulator [Chloroflexi bacterium]|nr:TetR/AcrR family transcriptional regulator [Chloroflexota bacterium]